MKKERLYLAADSGGSKTVWILLNEQGKVLKKVRTSGLGAVKEGILPVLQTITEAFDAISSFGEPSGIFLSLGGPNVSEVSNALKSVFGETVPICVEREACGNAILQAAKVMGCSAVVMCGTGSVAVGDTSQGRKYAGGWGPIYGDGGSGGGMGSEALRLFLRSFDVQTELGGVSSLFAHLIDGLDISLFTDRMELKNRAVNMSRRELAALAPEIYKLAENGDLTALSLYEKAALEIAELAHRVSDDSEDFCVLLCGGFFAEKPLLIDMLRKSLSKLSRVKFKYDPQFSPIVAAQMAALEYGKVQITDELFNKLLNN